MSDLNDLTQNVNIWNDEKSKSVTVTTDGAKERLDVQVQDDVEVISHEHDKVHQGQTFIVSDYGTYNKATYWDILIKAGPVMPHAIADLSVSLGILVQVYEEPTTTANGTSYTSFNRNRNSSNTSDTVIYDTPTVTSPGTLIRTLLIPGANQSGSAGGISTEIILKQSTDYLVRITSQQNSNLFSWAIIWYEEDV